MALRAACSGIEIQEYTHRLTQGTDDVIGISKRLCDTFLRILGPIRYRGAGGKVFS